MRAILLPLLAVLLLSACGDNENEGRTAGNNGNNVRQQANNDGNTLRQDGDGDDGQDTATADRLAAIAKSVPQVKDAYCLRLGNLAIVGIDVGGNLERSRVDNIKYTVAEALNDDPQGANAIVSADVDINQRIREMVQDSRAGRPLAGFAEELGDILGRLIPQVPRDTTPVPDGPAGSPDGRLGGTEASPAPGPDDSPAPVPRVRGGRPNQNGDDDNGMPGAPGGAFNTRNHPTAR